MDSWRGLAENLPSALLLDIGLTEGERVLGEDLPSVSSSRFKLSEGEGELG